MGNQHPCLLKSRYGKVRLLLLTVCGARWASLPLGGWAVGHGALMLLTQWDHGWDDMAVAHMLRRYRAFYDAG